LSELTKNQLSSINIPNSQKSFEMKKIAVLIPCLNEGLTIERVIKSFQKELNSAFICVCDNNSSDDTVERAEQCNVHVISESIQGKGNAVIKMFSDIDADIYILVDGDDTYPASQVHPMIKLLVETGAHMVVGDRLSNMTYKSENKRRFHNFGNHLIRRLINFFFKSDLQDILSGYRVFDRSFVKNYSSLATGFELETDLTLFALHYELPIKEYPINYKDRPKGSESKLHTIKDGSKVVMTFFDLYRLYKPLSFFSLLSFFLLICGLGLGVMPVYEFIKFHYVYKVPTAILASGLVIISLLFFCCGLILDSITIHDKKNTKLRIRNYR